MLLGRRLFSFDWFCFLLTITLSIMSLFFVYSTTHQAHAPYSLFFKKQLTGTIAGIGIYYGMSQLDARTLMRWGFFAYFCVMALLVFTIIKGTVGMGGQRWIDLFFFRVQTAELAKLFFPAFVAYYLYTGDTEATIRSSAMRFVPLLVLLGISFILIAKQPDLGTAIVVLSSGLITFWVAGLPTRFFVYGFCLLLGVAPLLWPLLKDYQKQRIFVFLGYGKSNKERYQIEQSIIAIGSGGIYGKGFMQGTQNRYKFLPESRTDCIFSVIAEELGFIGVIAVILLYIMLALYLFYRTGQVAFPYMQALAAGLIAHIMISAFINMAMVMGLLPMVGIPLPLISYGVSNVWITYASLGWLASIARQRAHRG